MKKIFLFAFHIKRISLLFNGCLFFVTTSDWNASCNCCLWKQKMRFDGVGLQLLSAIDPPPVLLNTRLLSTGYFFFQCTLYLNTPLNNGTFSVCIIVDCRQPPTKQRQCIRCTQSSFSLRFIQLQWKLHAHLPYIRAARPAMRVLSISI